MDESRRHADAWAADGLHPIGAYYCYGVAPVGSVQSVHNLVKSISGTWTEMTCVALIRAKRSYMWR